MSTLGERIIQAREAKGLKQNELAEALDITPTRLNYWEKDKRKPDVEMIGKIAKILEVDVSILLGTSSSKASNNIDEEHLLEKSISSFECFISYLNSIGFNVQFGTSPDGEQSSVTLSKGNETVGYTMDEFRKFQYEINNSVEFQVWKKQKGVIE